jgi:hypothetical protein
MLVYSNHVMARSRQASQLQNQNKTSRSSLQIHLHIYNSFNLHSAIWTLHAFSTCPACPPSVNSPNHPLVCGACGTCGTVDSCDSSNLTKTTTNSNSQVIRRQNGSQTADDRGFCTMGQGRERECDEAAGTRKGGTYIPSATRNGMAERAYGRDLQQITLVTTSTCSL